MVDNSSACDVLAGSRRTSPVHPGRLARRRLVPHVNLARRIFTDQHDGQPRNDAGLGRERGGFLGNLPANLLGKCFPIQNLSRHEYPSRAAEAR